MPEFSHREQCLASCWAGALDDSKELDTSKSVAEEVSDAEMIAQLKAIATIQYYEQVVKPNCDAKPTDCGPGTRMPDIPIQFPGVKALIDFVAQCFEAHRACLRHCDERDRDFISATKTNSKLTKLGEKMRFKLQKLYLAAKKANLAGLDSIITADEMQAMADELESIRAVFRRLYEDAKKRMFKADKYEAIALLEGTDAIHAALDADESPARRAVPVPRSEEETPDQSPADRGGLSTTARPGTADHESPGRTGEIPAATCRPSRRSQTAQHRRRQWQRLHWRQAQPRNGGARVPHSNAH